MKKSLSNLATALFSTGKRSNWFYLFAFVPILLFSYFSAEFPLVLMIPLYAFIILLLKKHKLFSHPKPPVGQRLLGLIVLLASFFAYFVVSPFFPQASFYGFANYFIYTVGLFLIFFEIHVLREAFSPLFLIGASLSSSYASDFAGTLFNPYLPHFTSFIVSLLKATGMAVTQSQTYPRMIVLFGSKGPIQLSINWACVGFISTYIFSIILVVLLYEDPSNIKTKITWSIIGVLGTFVVNIIRILSLVAGIYFYGNEYGQVIHSYIGYFLFITWSVIFFYLFSRRNTISQKIRLVHAKIWRRGTPAPS